MDLERFCKNSDWDVDTEFGYSSLLGYTRCFQEIVILGLIHLTYYVMCSFRLRQLLRNKNPTMMKNIAGQNWKIFLSIVNVLVPFGLLNTSIFSRFSEAPFETTSNVMTTVAWGYVTTLLILERTRYVQKGDWILRFLWIFSFVGRILKIRSIIVLMNEGDRNYYTTMYFITLIATLLLVLTSFIHKPQSQLYEQVEEEEMGLLGKDSVNENARPYYPLKKAGLLSRLVFWWTNSMITLGHKRPLEQEDMWELPPSEQSKQIYLNFSHAWEQEKKKDNPSLIRALNRAFGVSFYLAAIPKLLNDGGQFVGPLILGQLIAFTKDPSQPAYIGYSLALAIFLGQMVSAIGENHYFHTTMRTGLHLRAALINEIYDKSLKLSPKSRQERSTGAIVNYMSSDVEQLSLLCTNLHLLWSSPLRIIIALTLLFLQLGPASLAGVFALIVTIPLQARIVRTMAMLKRNALQSGDERIKLTNEILAGMRVIKYYAWENSFIRKIFGVRNNELEWLAKQVYQSVYNTLLINLNPIIVTLVTFSIYAVIPGNELTPSIAFTSLALFNVLRYPLIFFPQVITQVVSARVSLLRLQSFFLSEELVPVEISADPEYDVVVDNGTFSWKPDASSFKLNNINLKVPRGSLTVIIGSTGSGKSSILSAILGETPKLSGQVTVASNRLAYVPQEAWIFNGTIQDNILFGSPFDSEKYNKTIEVCSLTRDLELFPAGDQQEIGEKGINMSGGQKQRINLARSVYNDANIYLFDDPLSALDAHVGREIFETCFMGHLKDKTRILVTNQIQFVSAADQIVLLNHGEIIEKGTYTSLMQLNGEFASLMKKQGGKEEVEKYEKNTTKKKEKTASTAPKTVQKGDKQAKLITQEERETGSVKWSVYLKYIKASGGIRIFVIILLLSVFVELSRVEISWWLSAWSANDLNLSTVAYIGGYALGSIIQSLFTILLSFSFAKAGLIGARTLHDQLFAQIIRAKMSFFDTTPLGRIINRFSKDQGQVDSALMPSLQTFASGLFQLLSTLLVIAVVTPYTLAPFVPIFCAFFFVQVYFRSTARELKRLEAISRSPIYANFSETLNGLTTIRAYKAQNQMKQINIRHLDENQTVLLAGYCANRWLSMRVEFLGGSVILAAALFAVLARGTIEPSVVGLSLSYAFAITGLLNLTVRLFTETEKSFNSVERVLYYMDVQSEALPIIPDNRPDDKWPSKGEIEFHNVVMSYRPGIPPVLNDVTFKLNSAEKVGIVGRTGAGKSSLFQTLFRIVEIDNGSILIDSKNIHSYGLEDLRKKLAIIPQEPVLFTGTVRFNLDPFSEYTDAQIWEVIQRSHLFELIDNLPDKLSTQVTEGGDNFSVGQRQLMCLARAMLKQCKILVLDEATASVDVQTDALIQNTIRKEFARCTTLTIAHRLNTIIDCDRILVLDAGKVVEFASPKELLGSSSSVFYSLVQETGPQTARYLFQIVFGEVEYQKELDKLAASALQVQQEENIETADLIKESQVRGGLQESVLRAVRVLEDAIRNIRNEEWQNELQKVGQSEASWLSELRTLVRNLSNAASAESNTSDSEQSAETTRLMSSKLTVL